MALPSLPAKFTRKSECVRAQLSEPPALPPHCRIVGGVLNIDTSVSDSLSYLVVLAIILVLLAYSIPLLLSTGIAPVAFLCVVFAIPCAAFWKESAWRSCSFDLRRRFYQQTVFLLPFFRQRTLDTDDIAGIYAHAEGIWIVRKVSPRRRAKLGVIGMRVLTSTAESWANHLGEVLTVPSGCGFLAEFPQRNPRFSRYDAEKIAFRKHPFRRLIAAVFSKAFALASLVASGAISFALVRHVYVPVHLHFSLTTNVLEAISKLV